MKSRLITIAAGLAMVTASLSGCGNSNTSKKSSASHSAKKTTQVTSSASTAKYTPAKDLKSKYDVIIVGAGGAGMSAALAAKDKGLNPVILEKMPIAGGNTLKASSGMNASETKIQKKDGIKDTNQKFYEETLKGGHGTNDKKMLRFFVNHSASAVDWLDSMDIKLNNLTISGGMSVKRTHRPADGSAVGGYLVTGLLRNVKKQNIPVFVNTDVTKINQTNGKVSGVKVKINQDKTKTISSKAVIVTTGGYGASKKLIKKYRPDLANYVTTNQKGSTGDGIKLITAMGGYTVDMNKIQIHPTVHQKPAYLIGEATRGEGGILVNQNGKRFVNELKTRDLVSAAINKQPNKDAYVVFDSGVKARVGSIAQYQKLGFVKSADSWTALAKKLHVPSSTFETTMTDWNQAVKNKKDTDFNRTTGMDHQLNGKTCYAIKIAPGIHYTMGGVKINPQTEVLKESGQAIPGLFAAGEVTGGLHGSNRIGGNSVAEIIIFGRQAGTEAAKYLK
ncbi:flavocytochrome c [Lactiplantibacillus songbeiensis]|uniref:Flavocytochrome c n=1 Tax=Lactiplantibacillus songbeiensis TaxID=2559920 RepID=A0ABW4C022_9LACO|nr:flavocytochrome c [Lactiplantibacillus songbeiensis]